MNWFALLTRSNFEKTVFAGITNKKNKKIDAFLSAIRKKSRRKDRNLMIEVPLFQGYLFVRSTYEPAARLTISKTIGAVRILGNQSGPVSVPKSQIESLKILTRANMNLITGSNVRLEKGDPVIILEGSMAGVTGEFTQYKGKGCVAIKIDALDHYAGVEVSKDNVEKVSDLIFFNALTFHVFLTKILKNMKSQGVK